MVFTVFFGGCLKARVLVQTMMSFYIPAIWYITDVICQMTHMFTLDKKEFDKPLKKLFMKTKVMITRNYFINATTLHMTMLTTCLYMWYCKETMFVFTSCRKFVVLTLCIIKISTKSLLIFCTLALSGVDIILFKKVLFLQNLFGTSAVTF